MSDRSTSLFLVPLQPLPSRVSPPFLYTDDIASRERVIEACPLPRTISLTAELLPAFIRPYVRAGRVSYAVAYYCDDDGAVATSGFVRKSDATLN